MAVLVTCMFLSGGTAVRAQGEAVPQESKDKDRSWSNVADLSLVLTEGNSQNQSFGFSNDFRRRWNRSRLIVKLQATLANTDDDPYL